MSIFRRRQPASKPEVIDSRAFNYDQTKIGTKLRERKVEVSVYNKEKAIGLTFKFPVGMPKEESEGLIAETMDALQELYSAMGGDKLIVSRAEDTEEVAADHQP